MKFDTACIHGAKDKNNSTGSITVPIYQTAAFSHPAFGQSTGYDYSRTQNPTREYVEQTINKLEEGAGAIAFSTGMAALSTLMELFQIGDHIIASEDLYGGSIRLFDKISAKNGIEMDYIDTSDVEEVKKLIKKNTKALFIETPTNPTMHVTDIEAMAKICKNNHLLLMVDNTFLTPYFQKPILLGAHIVLHSGTKYLGGHNDTLAGFLVYSDESIGEKLRYIAKTMGGCLSPFDSFLIIRGIKTLALRMDKQNTNAMKIATWLTKQTKVAIVYYPGLPDHQDLEISKKQSTGFGGMISFQLKEEKTAIQILERVKIITFAESLGGVETLITYPITQTHADVPLEKLNKNGINRCLLRLSVGIENPEDLIEDLNQALNG